MQRRTRMQRQVTQKLDQKAEYLLPSSSTFPMIQQDSSLSSGSEFEASLAQASGSNKALLSASKNLMNSPVVAVLDRLQISDNAGTLLLTAFIKTCNGNVSNFMLSRSITRQVRIADRLKIAHDVFKEFTQKPPERLVLH